MAIPEIIEDIEFRAGNARLFAYVDGKLLGQAETIDGRIAIFPVGRKFRYRAGEAPSREALAAEQIAGAIIALAMSVRAAFPTETSDEPEQPVAN